MANIKKIKLPNGTTYDIKDSGALPLTGGTVTGPVIFQDTTSMDEATIGDLVVNGNASFTNNIQANTINGVVVGNSPKFTDTITTASTTGSGNAVTAVTASNGVLTVTKGSTFALTSDIPTKTSQLTNDSGFITASHTSTYSLPLAASGTRGGVQIGYSESGKNYAVRLSSEKMYVSVPWTDTKVTQEFSNFDTAQPILFRNNVGSGAVSSTDTTRFVNTVTITPSSGNISATTFNGYTLAAASAKAVDTSISAGSTSTSLPTAAAVAAFVEGKGYITSYTDTKNTAGSTNTSSKIFLVGATSQAANPQTYSHDTVYIGTDGCLYSNSTKVSVEGHTHSGYATSGHTHTLSLASSTGSSQLALAASTKYQLTAGGSTYIFTTPPNTTYSSKDAASGGMDVSLVTTGEKYTWNNKSNLTIGTTSTTAAAGDHTHGTGIGVSTDSASYVTLASNTQYKITAGGGYIYFRMPTIPTVPSVTENSVTGISISDHGTTSVGSASGWSAGTASTWAFEEVSIPNVTSAGSASTWAFEEKTIPNVTAVGSGSFTSGAFSGGSGSFSATVTNHVLSFSHTHTAATHGADSHTHTAPTLGTAIKVQSKSGGANGSAPTLGTAIKVQSKKSGSNSTVPSLTVTSTTVVNGKSHTITDNGHYHDMQR